MIRRPKPCPCGAVTLTKAHRRGRGYLSIIHYRRKNVAEVHADAGCRVIKHVKVFDTHEFKIEALS